MTEGRAARVSGAGSAGVPRTPIGALAGAGRSLASGGNFDLRIRLTKKTTTGDRQCEFSRLRLRSA
jgi:hypothetical protein